MTNPEFITMIERYHKPAQNVKIKAGYVLIGAAIIGVAYVAIQSSISKSKEIRQLKDFTSKNLESNKQLALKNAMLENNLNHHVSIINSLNAEKKALLERLKSVSSI
jgi:hypothetical protein